jgi:C1A family cysteine protease
LGSCTANAIAAAFEYSQVKGGRADFMPSRLFIYYEERKMEGSIESDAGAMIRDGVKVINKIGVVSEVEWPYDISKFAVEPTARVYGDARYHRSVRYQRVGQTLNTMRHCLAQGNPFVFGFQVYDSFMSDRVAKTGDVSMPGQDEDALGGHAVLAVGYKTIYGALVFICRNSWGEWGDKGYFYMPAAYLLDSNLCDDLWTISQVAGLQH